MRNKYLLIFLMFFSVFSLRAQDNNYEQALNEGIKLYNEEKYKAALAKFKAAKIWNDNDVINDWIEKSSITISIKLSKSELNFLCLSEDDKPKSVTVSTNAKRWWYESVPDWCSVTKDGNTMNISCSNNETAKKRSCNIIIKAGEEETKLRIIQNSKDIEIKTDPDILLFTSDAQKKAVTITTDAKEWHYDSKPSWCKVTKDGNAMNISCTENTSYEERYGEILIIAEDKEVFYPVRQEGLDISITMNPEILRFGAAEDIKTVTITTNAESWEVESVPNWCKVTVNDSLIIVKCQENPFIGERTGRITIKTYNKEVYMPVIQNNGDTTLYATPDKLIFDYKSSTQLVEISTNTRSWQYETDQDWIDVSQTVDNLSVTCLENNSYYSRSGHIRVYSGSISKVIDVRQGSKPTVFDASPKRIEFSHEGGTEVIEINSNVQDWTYDSIPEWCEVKKEDSKLVLTCKNNFGDENRSASLYLKANTKTLLITISQKKENYVGDIVTITSLPSKEKIIIDDTIITQTPYSIKKDYDLHSFVMGFEKRNLFLHEQTENIDFRTGSRFIQVTLTPGSSAGVLSGFVGTKSWGAYNHFQMGFPSKDLDYDKYDVSCYDYCAGPVYQFMERVSLFAGIGGRLYSEGILWGGGINIEGGVMVNYYHAILTLGYQVKCLGNDRQTSGVMIGLGTNIKRYYDDKNGYCVSDSRRWWSLNFVFNPVGKGYGVMFSDLGKNKVRGYVKGMAVLPNDSFFGGSLTAGIVFTTVPSNIDLCVGGGYGAKYSGNVLSGRGFEIEFGFVMNMWRFPVTVLFHNYEIKGGESIMLVDFGIGLNLGDYRKY